MTAASARVGMSELWLVDPGEPAVLVLRSGQDEAAFVVAADLGRGDVLSSWLPPGFTLPVAELVRP